MIYPNDHAPAHVRVKKAERDARVRLDPVVVVSNWGFSARELREIAALIQEHQRELLEMWGSHHVSR